MAKEYTYTNRKDGKIVFRSIEPNYATKEDVDRKVRENTGIDPRLDRGSIECQIRVVNEKSVIPRGRYDKNKKMS